MTKKELFQRLTAFEAIDYEKSLFIEYIHKPANDTVGRLE